MKFFIVLAVATVALAGDLNPVENRIRGHGVSNTGGSSRGRVWVRGRRDVADDLLVVENQDLLADQFAEESRDGGHSGGNIGGSWGGNHGSWGGTRGVRGTDLVDLVAEYDQALNENRLVVNGWGGRGNVGNSGHRGHRWGRGITLPALEGRARGWGGHTWGIPNQGQGNVWNRRW